MQQSRWIILQPDSNSIRLLYHVPVGDDVAFGIDNHAGAQGPFTNRATAAPSTALPSRTTEKAVKKVVKRIPIIVIGGTTSPALSLDSRFGVDVDDAGLELLRYQRELIGESLR